MKGIYKIIAVVSGILCVLGIAAGIYFWQEKHRTLSVIGGADGPTAIFVAGKVGGPEPFFTAAVILAAVAVGIYFLLRGK